ncbi:MAG: nitroreductase [Caldilineae bacterium]|nr:MAG: nitroreductase [Caldilineae bacterium]
MSFLELARARYSVRAYRPDPIPDELLQQVLEAARLAPTASNRQPFRLILIPTAGHKNELRRIYNRDWFVQAPLVLCACACVPESWFTIQGKRGYEIDVAIAVDHITLAATDVGLGTCWIAAFNPVAARQVLNLPRDLEPVIFTPLGFPADTPGPKERRPLTELVIHHRW